jgi:hypothetical protein
MPPTDKKLMGRRRFFTTVGAAAGAVGTTALLKNTGDAQAATRGGGARPATMPEVAVPASAVSASAAPAIATPPTFLGKLSVGTKVGRWTIAGIHPLRMGALPVVLAGTDGKRFQVDVMRRDDGAGTPEPVAHTRALSLYLANGGDGRRRTLEDQARGALALAAALAKVEAKKQAEPPALLTWRERRSQFPEGGYSVPL